MDRSFLVRLFGFPATLFHGDTLVLDRWLWISRHLPITRGDERLLDVGCGTGAFTIGSAKRGYSALGLSWDTRNMNVAVTRAQLAHAAKAEFEILDLRDLDSRSDLTGLFDVAVCAETIEHILDDRRLMKAIYSVLKPNGFLLLTTPNYFYKPMSFGDEGPFEPVETGAHVRRGYTATMIRELCVESGFLVDEISYCSGFLSQKTTALIRILNRFHPAFGWACTLPLRIFPPLLDPLIQKLTGWPGYSICLVAQKSRFTP